MKTLLASGNVVLASDLEPAAVKKEFEACLREAFGYDAWVVVLTATRVAELVEACPYPADDKATHTYITLASDTAALDELFAAGAALDGGGADPAGSGGPGLAGPGRRHPGQPLQQAVGQAEVQGSTTTRNLRTMIKVRDAAAARPSVATRSVGRVRPKPLLRPSARR